MRIDALCVASSSVVRFAASGNRRCDRRRLSHETSLCDRRDTDAGCPQGLRAGAQPQPRRIAMRQGDHAMQPTRRRSAEDDVATAWMSAGNCRQLPAGGVLPQRRRRRRPGPQDLRRLPGQRPVPRVRARAPHRARRLGWLQRARAAPDPQAPPRRLDVACADQTSTRRAIGCSAERRRRGLVAGGLSASVASAVVGRAGVVGLRRVLLPSARPVLNSFCALPRFLASFGSCDPPNRTSTTTMIRMISGGSRNANMPAG